MGGRILKFGVTAHQGSDMLLPWFVNGTLVGEELERVERHLRECARCQREVEWLRELQAAYSGDEMALDAAASLQKLRSRLDTPNRGWRLLSQWHDLRRVLRQMQPWTRWTVAVEFAVIFVLGALLLSPGKPAALYRTLGAADVAQPALGSLVVVFNPRTTEVELRRILRANGARVVDGPTAANAYVLEVPAGQQATVQQALRQEHVVELVERLGPENTR